MKIVLTGGGTGGHFYPLIAVAEQIKLISEEKKIVPPELYYFSTEPYSEDKLAEQGIKFIQIPAGKIRRYFSFKNFSDVFVTAKGFFKALWKLFVLYPDAIFSKGAYVSVPTVVAASILRIPIIVHESDSRPGRANTLAAKFATKVAVSYPDAGKYFNPKKVAWTGNPLRTEITLPIKEGAHQAFGLNADKPVILVLGGSQGAVKINNALLDTLPSIIDDYQVIHQAGPKNFESVQQQSEITLENSSSRANYKVFPYLSEDMIRKAAGIADLVISRAGSTIFEIAVWNLPSIIIPIPENVSHDQRSNAYNYMRSGACSVIEEMNLRPEIITSEIHRIFNHPEVKERMVAGAKSFARVDAAHTIAEELISIGISHEK
jgi:UDP-N-acetylglucosamine--N-acetylmuramyl-(pentapeptide) pyrophosphoryl-undecaprenol N-acetylglucosamine transferase